MYIISTAVPGKIEFEKQFPERFVDGNAPYFLVFGFLGSLDIVCYNKGMLNDEGYEECNMKDILEVLTKGETLEVEFKSDLRKISDGEIYEEIVAMANTKGGILLIGVDDDGRIVGCKPRHGRTTDPLKMQSAIFNNTVPNINTRVTVINHPGGNILSIEVDRYPEPCATASGKWIY
jgi:hypothetical protein